MAKHYPQVLSIAGADSSGGAGIQADLKTFSALGCYAMTVITALTAQNTMGIWGGHPVPPRFTGVQLDAVFEDLTPDATKIGMVYSAEQIEVIAAALKRHDPPNVVVDPVLVSQSGFNLLEDRAKTVLKRQLMPLATLITPNIPEASALLNRPIKDLEDMRAAATELAAFTKNSVLLKGGHMKGDAAIDILFLYPENRFVRFERKRVHTRNDHGTGCTLSSAIAAFLAKGRSLEESVGAAKAYITKALEAGAAYEVGKGRGPVHHFHDFW